MPEDKDEDLVMCQMRRDDKKIIKTMAVEKGLTIPEAIQGLVSGDITVAWNSNRRKRRGV